MGKAADRAYALVRAGIMTGEFSRGDRLRETDLAQRAGVSRTRVREALRRLDAEGLVAFTSNRGASVTAWSESELDDLYEARAVMEGYAAERAATRITAAELDHLTELAAGMRRLAERSREEDVTEITRLNSEFHRTITAAGRNVHMASLVHGITDVTLVHRTFRLYSRDRLMASMFHHDEVVVALRAGDAAWAGAIIRAHILAARTTVGAAVARTGDSGADAGGGDGDGRSVF